MTAATSQWTLPLRVTAVMWRREMMRYLRDRSMIFGGFSRTVLWLIILGFGLGAALREIEGYTYAQYILPGVIVLNILFASLQCSISLVWDREVGVLREVLVSPAPMYSVATGKILGGATVAVIQGSIPFLFAPLIGLGITFEDLLLAWLVMFAIGVMMTSLGVIIATRMRTFEGFGSISNGVIQPLYFLSGSIFPLKGVIGGVGFLQIPMDLRLELKRIGIRAIGGGWIVQLPLWLQVLVYINPVSYQLDLLRSVTLNYQQLPMLADLLITALLPVAAAAAATFAMTRMRSRKH